MGSIQYLLLSLIVLFVDIKPVEAYYIYYGSTWYIYVIVVFVVIAISSCIGACVRYKRNQMVMQQRNIMLTQGAAPAGFNVTTTSAVNQGYYPPPGSYPTQGYPPSGFQQPPAYAENQAGATPVKDPNMPPQYDEAVTAPSYPGSSPYPGSQVPQTAPYPPQTAPYPTQTAPYPTQP